MEKHFCYVRTTYKDSRARSKSVFDSVLDVWPRFRFRLCQQPACILPCSHLVIFSTEEELRGNTAVLVERGVRLNASANSLNTLVVKGKGGGLGGRSV